MEENFSLKQTFAACFLALTAAAMIFAGAASAADEPIVLRTMGSLFFGGTVTKLDNGETFHGDHGYAQYFIPMEARDYPLIMWHGIGQSGRSFESTPDGREGFMAIMPRRGWATYIIDQPRRGRAGRTLETAAKHTSPTTMLESAAWDAFRNGVWDAAGGKAPYFFDGVQFPRTPEAVEQFFRQQTPDTGMEPRTDEYYRFMGRTMGELLKQTGPAVLMTHSNSGKYGWFTAIESPEGALKAIIAFEPGHFVMPEGEDVPEIPAGCEAAKPNTIPIRVPEADFMKLTKIPILIVYSDNIASEPSPIYNVNVWRISLTRSRHFAEAVNRRSGDVRVLHLPEIGIKGNTHAAFADLNNLEIAEVVEKFLAEKKLDGRAHPHTGPAPKNLTEYTIPLAAE